MTATMDGEVGKGTSLDECSGQEGGGHGVLYCSYHCRLKPKAGSDKLYITINSSHKPAVTYHCWFNHQPTTTIVLVSLTIHGLKRQ
jgi:hypothetical protein